MGRAEDTPLAESVFNAPEEPGPYERDSDSIPVVEVEARAETVQETVPREAKRKAPTKKTKQKKLKRNRPKDVFVSEPTTPEIVMSAMERVRNLIPESAGDFDDGGRGPAMIHQTDEEFYRSFVEDCEVALGEGFIAYDDLPRDLHERVRFIVTYSRKYAPDFILDQLEKLAVAGVPMDTIASRFRVGITTIYRWKKKLRERYRKRALFLQTGDQLQIMGKQITWFELRIRMGYQMAQKTGASRMDIVAGMKIAETAHCNLIKYQELAGFYLNEPMRRPKVVTMDEDDEHAKGAKFLTDSFVEMLKSMDVPEAEIDGEDVNTQVG